MDLDVARFAVALVMLAGGVVSDLRTRRVSNKYWLPFAAAAALFLVVDLITTSATGRELAVAYGGAAVLCGLVYLLWRLQLFGGADAKGLMVLAFLLPWPLPPSDVPIPPAFDALANAAVLLMLLPVALLVWNALHGHFRFPAALLGTPMPLDEARRRHVWPMQVVQDGTLRWRFWQRLGGDMDATYDALRDAGVEKVWATPKIPFLLPLALGLLVAWFYGNFALRFVLLLVA